MPPPESKGTYVPFAQLKPKSGLSGAVAFKQITVDGSELSGNSWMFLNW